MKYKKEVAGCKERNVMLIKEIRKNLSVWLSLFPVIQKVRRIGLQG